MANKEDEEELSNFERSRRKFSKSTDDDQIARNEEVMSTLPPVEGVWQENLVSPTEAPPAPPPPVPPPPVPKRPAVEKPQGPQTVNINTAFTNVMSQLSSLGAFKRASKVAEFRVVDQQTPTDGGGSRLNESKKQHRIAVSGEMLIVAVYNLLHVFDIPSGKETHQIAIGAAVTCLYVCKADETLWVGTADGSVFIFHLSPSITQVHQRAYAHSTHSVNQILEHGSDMLTLDSTGVLIVWPKRGLTLKSRVVVLPMKTRR